MERPSYVTIRLEKYKGGAIRGMQIHDQRQRPGRSRTNPDIDWGRTGDNVDLLHPEGGRVDFRRAVDGRIAELNLSRKRSDAVEMVGVLVAVSPEWAEDRSPEEIRSLYEDAFGFVARRYGGPDNANLVSAVIHMDEKTPHLHVNFVPVTDDGRLSAKDVVGGRQDLRRLQDDLAREVGEPRGLSRGVEGSRARHVEIPELKRQMRELERVREEISSYRGEIDALRREGRELGIELEGLRAGISSARASYPEAREIGETKPTPAPLTGNLRGISVERVESLKAAARERLALESDVSRLRSENDRLREASRRLQDSRGADREALEEARDRLDEIDAAKKRDPELGERLDAGIERERAIREREEAARERDEWFRDDRVRFVLKRRAKMPRRRRG
jgi:hypothetical protein